LVMIFFRPISHFFFFKPKGLQHDAATKIPLKEKENTNQRGDIDQTLKKKQTYS
jgi:hypothetical protein